MMNLKYKAAACPCKGCEKRSMKCHSECADYAEYSASPSIIANPITPADSVRIATYQVIKTAEQKKEKSYGR